MAIKTVSVVINGVTTALTYNASAKKWEGTITAPGSTSFTKSGGYYPVTVTATNDAGTVVTKSDYQLVVKENVKPTISISSPTSGAYVSNSKQPIVFTIVDESGGSGVNINSLVIKLDGTKVASGIVNTAITNGYSVTYTPSTAMSDGSHTVTIDCSDNDGNVASTKTTTFKVDTIPPSLNVSTPTDGTIINNANCVVSGTTNDTTSSPVTLTVNGTAVTVASNGTWTKTITLIEGSNTITVVAKDAAGRTTTVTRTVTLNTSVPVISNITINPNPATTGATMTITVEVTNG